MQITKENVILKIIRWLAAILFTLVFTAVVVIYGNSPEITPFKNNEIFIPQHWEISSNQTEVWETVLLPADIQVRQGDSASIKTVLSEQISDGAVLFFKSNDTSVSVSVDGEEIFTTGYEGKYIGRVWHFIELPRDCAGKTLLITQKQVLNVFFFPMTFLEVGIANTSAAIYEYFNQNHLFIFYASTVLCLISLVTLFISLYDMRKNSQSKRLLYMSLTFILIAVWSISESPMTHLYFSGLYFNKPYLLTYASFLAGMTFTVPAMLYYGEYYGRKRIFEWMSLISVAVAVIIYLADLLSVYTVIETFMVSLVVRTFNMAVILAFTLVHMLSGKHRPKQSMLIVTSNIATCIMGIVEAFRLLVFHEQTISLLFYMGMAFFLFARIFEAVTSYFMEQEHVRNMSLLVEIQRGYYPMIVERINDIRVAEHDLRHHLTIVQGFADTGDTEKITGYITEFYGKAKQDAPLHYCEHYTSNVILQHFSARALALNIKLTVKANIPEDIGLPDADICAVMSNLLENAIEACEAEPENKRWINVIAGQVNDIYVIEVENSFDGLTETEERKFLSRKAQGREGVGLASVRAIAERYGGNVRFEPDMERGVFHSSAMLKSQHSPDFLTV